MLSTIRTSHSHQENRTKNPAVRQGQLVTEHEQQLKGLGVEGVAKTCTPEQRDILVNNLLRQQGNFYSFDITRRHGLDMIAAECRMVLFTFTRGSNRSSVTFLEVRGQSRRAVFSELHWRSSALKESVSVCIYREPRVQSKNAAGSR